MQRHAQRIDQQSRGVFCLAADDHCEIILLETSQQRSGRQSSLQMFGDVDDHGVAAGSSQRVVDFVKAVEIDQCKHNDAGTAPRQRLAETLDHGALIGQAGQIVVTDQFARRFGASIERTQEMARCA